MVTAEAASLVGSGGSVPSYWLHWLLRPHQHVSRALTSRRVAMAPAIRGL